MSEMVERVARAIYGARLLDLGDRDYGFEHLSDYDKRLLENAARLAIEAMREPTEAMKGALQFYGMLDGDPDEAWDKTIDAALQPPAP